MPTDLALRLAQRATTKQKEDTARLKADIAKSITETQREIESTKQNLQTLESSTTSKEDPAKAATRETLIRKGRKLITRFSENLTKHQRLYEQVSNTHMECQREILEIRSRLDRDV
ncbi:hypothetical protein PG990_002062 [Apiospora arundinis]|uniref:Uncharacterized protein n=1 Tax=Apiospora arundinis TaxID=335852 RepID=A0ABR2I438_9PEZI